MVDDVIKSIRAHLYHRISNPFTGAFVISWSMWNYSFFIGLFSALSPDAKISFITSHINWMSGLFGPLGTALFFVFIYPYPTKWIYAFWEKRQKELKDLKRRIEDETPLTIDESRKIRAEIRRAEITNDELNVQLSNTKNDNKRLENELDAFRRSREVEVSEKLSDDEAKILKFVADNNDQIAVSLMFEKFLPMLDRTKIQYNLDKLRRKNFLITDSYELSGNTISAYHMTESGRTALVEQANIWRTNQ